MTPPRLLTAAEVEARTNIKAATWYSWRSRKRRDVPQPIPLAGRRLAWIESEVDAWVADQIAARDAALARQAGAA